MQLSYNAPAPLWDEFCTTSMYLTNFTALTSLNGKMPYKFWFGHKPSLSHLREIGCRAFALIQTHNPKNFQQSMPWVLIGYAPHAKAYHLWDTTTGRIFNSYHVTFIKHLQSQPSDLLLGTTINLNPDAPPSWDSMPILRLMPLSSILDPDNNIDESIPNPILPSFPPIIPNQASPSPHNSQNTPPPVVSSTVQPLTIPSQNNNTITNNTNTASNNTIQPITIPNENNNTINNNTNTASNNMIQPITIPNENNNTVTNNHNNNNNNNNTVTNNTNNIPPPLRHSAHLLAHQASNTENLHTVFLSEYIPSFNTHDDILPLEFIPSDFGSINAFITSISDGSVEPDFDTNDDLSWVTAMRSPEQEYWIAGACDELHSLADLQVFTLIPHSDVPHGRCPLKGKLVCKRKQDDAGNVVHYKVRYVAKGYTQCYGVNYDKTTAPTAQMESFHTLMHLAASLNWDIQHIDIKMAFLHGILPDNETAYLEQPKGFEEPSKESWVIKLRKSIYGMKQAGCIWNQTFHDTVTSLGFEQNKKDPCIYCRQSATGTVIFSVHVDDIYSIVNPPEENTCFKEELRSKWEISDLGNIKFTLGITIERNRNACSISLSQTAFINRLVACFNLSKAYPVDTPMTQGLQICCPDKSIPPDPMLLDWIKQTPYRELIGSLNYIAVATQPVKASMGLDSMTCTKR